MEIQHCLYRSFGGIFFASGQRMGLFAALIYLFGLLPLLELLLRGNTHNMDVDAAKRQVKLAFMIGYYTALYPCNIYCGIIF